MAEPGLDTDVDLRCDGECEVCVDVPASPVHIDSSGDVPADSSKEDEPGLDTSEIADPDALRAWVEGIAPADFVTPMTEAFFARWDALGMPELDSDALYRFSGTPEETHAAALAALDTWKLPKKPDPVDEGPTLRSFTTLVLG